jgi:hypothetical protein
MNLRETLADIHALEEELIDFERKYGGRGNISWRAKGYCTLGVDSPAVLVTTYS